MKLTGVIVAAALGLFAAGEAQALPAAPVAALTSTSDAGIILARAGCGFGAHRGPYGGCRLNRGPRGDMRRMMTGAPRGCPPGLYRGRYGHCHR